MPGEMGVEGKMHASNKTTLEARATHQHMLLEFQLHTVILAMRGEYMVSCSLHTVLEDTSADILQ